MPEHKLPIPDRIYVERDEETNVINAYSCRGMGEEYVRASSVSPPQDDKLREALHFSRAVVKSALQWHEDRRVAIQKIGPGTIPQWVMDGWALHAALSQGEDNGK